MTDKTPIIRFEHVHKDYGERSALADFSLDIDTGEFLTVVGGSGGGKTTMLKMINGLIRPDTGKIFIRGEDIAGMDLVRLRRNIGYVIQGTGLFPHMTIWQNIAYVPSLLNRRQKGRTKAAVERLMDIMELTPDMANRYPSELSGGQQQRVGIARALAASPDIVLMDEPFGAVDEITRKTLQTEILRLHKKLGLTIVFVTHDIREALHLGSRVLVMNDGRLAQVGTSDEILASPADNFVAELVTLKC